MNYWEHSSRLVALLVMIWVSSTLMAQDDDTVSVVGSGIVLPVFESLVEAADAETDLNISVTGTDAGINAFCNGEAAVVATTRPLTSGEDDLCGSNNIIYNEYVIGHSIPVFITHPDNDWAQCLTDSEISALFAPSGAAQITEWVDLLPELAPEPPESTENTEDDETSTEAAETVESDIPPLSLFVPPADDVTYLAVDRIASGDGLRPDATLAPADDIITGVAETAGAIGVVSLSQLPVDAEVNIVEINFQAQEFGCASPSPETVEDRIYPAGDRLLLYVNMDTTAGLTDMLQFVVSEDTAEIVQNAGFTPATSDAYMTNIDALTGEIEPGRQFSSFVTEFQVPPSLVGEIAIAGAAAPYPYVNGIATNLSNNQQNFIANVTMDGEAAGIRRLCNGEADIIFTVDGLTDEDIERCEANDVTPVTINFGTQATVLVAHEGDAFSLCLTTDQVSTIWQASSAETVTQWADVAESFPEQDMTLFAPNLGNAYTDILLDRGNDVIPPLRADTEVDTDALYRAAAVANVEGSLTYMGYPDYLRVLENEQANIQLVSVDDGSGCVVPDEDSILDGSYPLSRSVTIVAAQESLTDINVQSFLWLMFSDENFTGIEGAGFLGIDFGDLSDRRDQLESAFETAQDAIVASNTADPADTEATGEDNTATTDNGEATEEATDEETE